ncbi:alpha/beta hydrolase family esterase [Sphingomonas qilianensis]|uniref:PHB depolymerase family esterase n=1 Tax=Sphingomonas qilianensis TaxID=1736690 RepID=A0ABU9XQA5_9SPHN
MARISETLAELAAARLPGGAGATRESDALQPLTPTGRNPGALGAWMYVPADLPPGAPLVVVLHGCTQTAAGFDYGTGWSTLAERAGFALLFPEQRRGNNMNLCFNWFQSADIARLGGEAESIAELTEQMIATHDLDAARVFVTGLSAGGAMTAVMLATYPDLFAAGAIIGGLPYDCANGVSEAMARMAGRFAAGGDTAAVMRAAPGTRRPRVSIWHGSADHTVVIGNLDRLAAQWRGAHDLGDAPGMIAKGAGWTQESWISGGETLVETWRITGMGHGVPIDPEGAEQLGAVGPYMLAAGIDSTAMIAKSWGLLPAKAARVAPATKPSAKILPPKRLAPRHAKPAAAPKAAAKPIAGIQGVIENALRAAGLMK